MQPKPEAQISFFPLTPYKRSADDPSNSLFPGSQQNRTSLEVATCCSATTTLTPGPRTYLNRTLTVRERSRESQLACVHCQWPCQQGNTGVGGARGVLKQVKCTLPFTLPSSLPGPVPWCHLPSLHSPSLWLSSLCRGGKPPCLLFPAVSSAFGQNPVFI